MSPLGGWFRKDWTAVLAEARELLGEGEPVNALRLALRVAGKAEEGLAVRARALAVEARAAVVASVMAKAEAAEAKGDWADAADWLLSAIEHLGDDPRADELAARREGLLTRLDEEASPFVNAGEVAAAELGAAGFEEEVDGGEVQHEALHYEALHYEALVEMLRPDARAGWAGRSEAFRRAVVDLNEGRGEEALRAFEALAEAEQVDATLAFERGRARLATGDRRGAMDDFEAAWEGLGTEPLDASGALSAPALWAEAALESGEAGLVAERLEPVADPDDGGPEVCLHYASALLATGRGGKALAHLERLGPRLPPDPRFPRLFAALLAASGQGGRAISVLERAVAPSCAGGSCGRPPKDLPSLRALAALHLEHGGSVERSRELLALVALERGGRLEGPDYELLARYYRRVGQEAVAAEAEAEAVRLVRSGELESAPPPALGLVGRVL